MGSHRQGGWIAALAVVAAAGCLLAEPQPSSAAAPPNDDFADAQPVSPATGVPAHASGTNVGATIENGEPTHAGRTGGSSVWFEWTAADSAHVSIDTCGSNFDTLLAVYTGESLSELQPVADDNDAAAAICSQPHASRVEFETVAGTTYKVAVDGLEGRSGSIELAIDQWTRPRVEISDAQVVEGDYGERNLATFTVTLIGTSSQWSWVDFRTIDGTAIAGHDYGSRSGTLSVPAGEGTRTEELIVELGGDSVDEPDETFFVELVGAKNAEIARSAAMGLIYDDDEPVLVREPGKGPVRMSTSGDRSELIKTIPITRRGKKRVVMQIPPRKLRLRAGDAIETSAELQVSTTCLEPMRKCVGNRYRYSPRVSGKLVLSRRAKGTGGIRVSQKRKLRCSQKLPHRNHHCVLVFPPAKRKLPAKGCQDCYLNLVVSARHKRAKKRNKLVVGSDAHNGVQQDRGRLSAVTLAPGAMKPTLVLERDRFRQRVRVARRKGTQARRKVIYSLPLGVPSLHEQLSIDARARIRTRHLPYGTFIGSDLVLSDRPGSTSTPDHLRQAATVRGQIGEKNGFNCTRERSAHSNPCAIRKVGVVRLKRRVSQPVYVNLVVNLGARYGGKWRKRHRAKVLDRGSIRVARYPTSGWVRLSSR